MPRQLLLTSLQTFSTLVQWHSRSGTAAHRLTFFPKIWQACNKVATLKEAAVTGQITSWTLLRWSKTQNRMRRFKVVKLPITKWVVLSLFTQMMNQSQCTTWHAPDARRKSTMSKLAIGVKLVKWLFLRQTLHTTLAWSFLMPQLQSMSNVWEKVESRFSACRRSTCTKTHLYALQSARNASLTATLCWSLPRLTKAVLSKPLGTTVVVFSQKI